RNGRRNSSADRTGRKKEKREKKKKRKEEDQRSGQPDPGPSFLLNGYSLFDTASAETGMRVSAGLLAVIQSDGVVVVIDDGVFIHGQLVDGRKVFFLGLKVGLRLGDYLLCLGGVVGQQHSGGQ